MTNDDASRIHDRIDTLATNTGNIETRLAAMVEALDAVKDRVSHLSITVGGNGKEGVDARLIRLEVARKSSTWWTMLWTTLLSNAGVGVVVGVVVGLVLMVFEK